jgi:hypothetical protein
LLVSLRLGPDAVLEGEKPADDVAELADELRVAGQLGLD